MRHLTTTLLVIAFGGLYLLSPFALPTTASLSHTALSRAAEARALGQNTETITEANWQQHPKICCDTQGRKRGRCGIEERRFQDLST